VCLIDLRVWAAAVRVRRRLVVDEAVLDGEVRHVCVIWLVMQCWPWVISDTCFDSGIHAQMISAALLTSNNLFSLFHLLQIPLASLVDLCAVPVDLKSAAVLWPLLCDKQLHEASLMMKKLLQTWLQFLHLVQEFV